jgi:hypothetical protein
MIGSRCSDAGKVCEGLSSIEVVGENASRGRARLEGGCCGW